MIIDFIMKYHYVVVVFVFVFVFVVVVIIKLTTGLPLLSSLKVFIKLIKPNGLSKAECLGGLLLLLLLLMLLVVL